MPGSLSGWRCGDKYHVQTRMAEGANGRCSGCTDDDDTDGCRVLHCPALCADSPPCDSKSAREARGEDGDPSIRKMVFRKRRPRHGDAAACPRSPVTLAKLGVDPDAQTPGSVFLSSLHTERTHLSSAPGKEPMVYCRRRCNIEVGIFLSSPGLLKTCPSNQST